MPENFPNGQRHALTGITLGEIDVARQPAQVRQPVHGDGELPAPGMLDAFIRKLGKDAQHVGPDEAGDIARLMARIGFAAAEEQPVVGRAAKIIDDEFGIADRDIVADQGACTGFSQGLGCHDVVGDRHDLAGDARLEAAEIGIAA